MNVDQATHDRAVAVMLNVAEDEGNDAETRLAAAQGLLYGDTEAEVADLRAAIVEAVNEAVEEKLAVRS